jgi:hypothetical protein
MKLSLSVALTLELAPYLMAGCRVVVEPVSHTLWIGFVVLTSFDLGLLIHLNDRNGL